MFSRPRLFAAIVTMALLTTGCAWRLPRGYEGYKRVTPEAFGENLARIDDLREFPIRLHANREGLGDALQFHLAREAPYAVAIVTPGDAEAAESVVVNASTAFFVELHSLIYAQRGSTFDPYTGKIFKAGGWSEEAMAYLVDRPGRRIARLLLYEYASPFRIIEEYDPSNRTTRKFGGGKPTKEQIGRFAQRAAREFWSAIQELRETREGPPS